MLADSLLPPARYANVQLPDPRQERQAKALMETVRCLVCQGQSIADSNAEMAGDMRSLIRERIDAGESPESIRAWLVSRYGEWVTYTPELEPATWPLWAAPIRAAARRTVAGARALSPEEEGLMGWVLMAGFTLLAGAGLFWFVRRDRGAMQFARRGPAARARRLRLAGPSRHGRQPEGSAGAAERSGQ